MRSRTAAAGCFLAEPDSSRADREADADDKKGVVERHDEASRLTSLHRHRGLWKRGRGIESFADKIAGQGRGSPLRVRVVNGDGVADTPVMELCAPGDEGGKDGDADISADVKDG